MTNLELLKFFGRNYKRYVTQGYSKGVAHEMAMLDCLIYVVKEIENV